MKHSFRVSLRCCGKDVVAGPKNSTLQVISMWSWGWCVQTKKDIEELNEMYGPLCLVV